MAVDGEAPEAIIAAIRDRERTKKTLVAELAAMDGAPDLVGAESDIRAEALALLKEWRGLLTKHVAISRQMMRKLLDRERFVFYPTATGYELGVTPSLEKFFGAVPSLKKAVASPTGFEPVFWP